MDNLVPIEQSNLTIMPTQAVMEYFLNNQQSPGTSKVYGNAIRAFFAWTGGKPYKEITPFMALEYNEYLEQHDADATVQNKISALTRFFGFVLKCGLIQQNPFAVVKQKAVPNKAAGKFLTAKEIHKLLIALSEKGEKHYILGLLLSSTGMRISEVQQLSWCDFMEAPDGTILINALRKGNERQLLPLRQDVFEVIQAYMKRPLNQFDKTPLFLNPSKERATTVTLRTWIEEAAKKAKITKKVTPHTLRHSFASLSLSQGADLRNVQWYLNHKNIKTTQIYLHPTNQKVGEYMPINLKKDDE